MEASPPACAGASLPSPFRTSQSSFGEASVVFYGGGVHELPHSPRVLQRSVSELATTHLSAPGIDQPEGWFLFLHGILGRRLNWRGIARRFVESRPELLTLTESQVLHNVNTPEEYEAITAAIASRYSCTAAAGN